MNNEMTITQRLAAIAGKVGAIGKDESNQQLKFKYRGIDSIRNKLNPLLSYHGVVMTCQILSWDVSEKETEKEYNGKKYIQTSYHCQAHAKYSFACDTGEISTEVIASSIDYSDKAPTQVMSMLQKQAFIQVFNIPTDEQDPDGKTIEVKVPAKNPNPAPEIRTIPDDKFSFSALESWGWNGEVSELNRIVLKGKGGKKVVYQLTKEQVEAISSRIKKKQNES